MVFVKYADTKAFQQKVIKVLNFKTLKFKV